MSLSKGQENEAELKMQRFSLGVTRMDRIRNEQIIAKVKQFGEARPGWFRPVLWTHIGKRMLVMELPGRRKIKKTLEKIHGDCDTDIEKTGIN